MPEHRLNDEQVRLLLRLPDKASPKWYSPTERELELINGSDEFIPMNVHVTSNGEFGEYAKSASGATLAREIDFEERKAAGKLTDAERIWELRDLSDEELLAAECKHYGIHGPLTPPTLHGLLRHLYNNRDAVYDAKDSLIKMLEDDLKKKSGSADIENP